MTERPAHPQAAPGTTAGGPTQVDSLGDLPGMPTAIRLIVIGAVLAILGPLAGFLVGSMVGPSKSLGDYDAMYVAMFTGLLVGSVGAVLFMLGALRWVRVTRGHL